MGGICRLTWSAAGKKLRGNDTLPFYSKRVFLTDIRGKDKKPGLNDSTYPRTCYYDVPSHGALVFGIWYSVFGIRRSRPARSSQWEFRALRHTRRKHLSRRCRSQIVYFWCAPTDLAFSSRKFPHPPGSQGRRRDASVATPPFPSPLQAAPPCPRCLSASRFGQIPSGGVAGDSFVAGTAIDARPPAAGTADNCCFSMPSRRTKSRAALDFLSLMLQSTSKKQLK